MISGSAASHSSDVVAPGRVPVATEDRADRRWMVALGPRRDPARAGIPGRRQSTQATRSPKHSRVRACRRPPSPARCPNWDGGDRHGRPRPGRASRCRSRVRRHLARAGSSRRRRPSHPRGPRPGNVDQGTEPIEAKDGEPGLGQRSQVAAEPLTHSSSTGEPRDRIDPTPLAERRHRRSSCCAGRRPGGATERSVRRRSRADGRPSSEEASSGGVGLAAEVRESLIDGAA